MAQLPREARDGIMRAWLEILKERHPGVFWVPISCEATAQDAAELAQNGVEEMPLAA